MKKKEGQQFEIESVSKRVEQLLRCLGEGIYEKEGVLAMALLCAVAGESIFLLGPPGTAKSMVARRLKMVFSGARTFEYLMSRFSTPDELFGPVSLAKLREENKYERQVEGYLPDAEVVFLDEIWKAGPAIQNALLTVLNERIYRNGSETIRVPMKVLIAASNELPAEDEGLEALWDRFLVRMVSNPIANERTFYKMIRAQGSADPAVPPELVLGNDELLAWRQSIRQVDIPDDVLHQVTEMRRRLRLLMSADKEKSLDYYISDRRWKKALGLLQASAWLSGRSEVGRIDCLLLIHCLWNKAECIEKILDVVLDAFTAPVELGINKVNLSIDKLVRGKVTATAKPAAPSEDDFQVVDYFFWKVKNFFQGNCLFLRTNYNHIASAKPTPGLLYFDDKRMSWIVEPFDDNGLFANKKSARKGARSVNLQRCKNGIVIDEVPYLFALKNAEPQTPEPLPKDSPFIPLMEQFDGLRETFDQLQSDLRVPCLFASPDDLKLLADRLKSTEQQLGELGVRLSNAQKLMD